MSDKISQTVNQVKITFPSPLSKESWRLILQEKPLVEIWIGKDRKKYDNRTKG